MRYTKHTSFLILAIACFTISCSQSGLLPSEYVSWVENPDNGLRVTKSIDKFDFTLQYKPHPYVVVVQEKTNDLEAAILHQGIEKIRELQYYTLRIGSNDGVTKLLRNGISNEKEYEERLNYFAFQMQQDLFLLDGSDSLPCRLMHFERTYTLTPYSNFVLAFERPDSNTGAIVATDKTLIYNDQILATGPIRITIDGAAINKLPKLDVL